MKQFLRYSIFITSFLILSNAFSQTYKTDTRDIFSWDDVADDWKQETHEVYTYANGGDKETKITGYDMPGMVLAFQDIKMYNSDNNIVSEERQFWLSGTSSWLAFSLVEYAYDGSGNLTSETNKTYDIVSMTFKNTSRDLYEDYSGSDAQKETHQEWNTTTNQWDNKEQLVLTYGSPGNPSSAMFYNWIGGAWVVAERFTATYDMGQISQILKEVYNTGSWEDAERTSFTYTGGLETQRLQETWNMSSWVNKDRDLSTYDGNGNREIYVFENWDDANTEWDGFYKEEKSFSLASSLSTDSFENASFKIHPIPAREYVNVTTNLDVDSVELYDFLGKKVRETSSLRLDVIGLSPGVYLLKINKGQNSMVEKIVVDR